MPSSAEQIFNDFLSATTWGKVGGGRRRPTYNRRSVTHIIFSDFFFCYLIFPSRMSAYLPRRITIIVRRGCIVFVTFITWQTLFLINSPRADGKKNDTGWALGWAELRRTNRRVMSTNTGDNCLLFVSTVLEWCSSEGVEIGRVVGDVKVRTCQRWSRLFNWVRKHTRGLSWFDMVYMWGYENWSILAPPKCIVSAHMKFYCWP